MFFIPDFRGGFFCPRSFQSKYFTNDKKHPFLRNRKQQRHLSRSCPFPPVSYIMPAASDPGFFSQYFYSWTIFIVSIVTITEGAMITFLYSGMHGVCETLNHLFKQKEKKVELCLYCQFRFLGFLFSQYCFYGKKYLCFV